MSLVHAQMNQAPCTEDSHCSVGFYCEETALYCRKCMSCEDHRRESPLQLDFCVKSVVQCGDCLKGLVVDTGEENINTGCIAFVQEPAKHHPYLPSYAWAAIAIGIILMLLTICVFIKTKMFKIVSYSSRTSVHSLHATEAAECEASLAPPPYNHHLPHNFPPVGSAVSELPDMRRVVDSPELCSKPPSQTQVSRPREAVRNQEARVFNNPAYVRLPKTHRCNTPEISTSEMEIAAVPVHQEADSTERIQAPGNIAKLDNNMNLQQDPRCTSHDLANKLIQRTRILAPIEIEDSNNNCPPQPSGLEHKSAASTVFGGPSFVINVVENINNLQQRNQVNSYHAHPS